MAEQHSRPAWLTEDLADEWVSQEDEPRSLSDRSHPVSEVSFAHSSDESLDETGEQSGPSAEPTTSGQVVGSVCIREDLPAAQVPLPTRTNVTGGGKGLFTPLALERMFEPPSPPRDPPGTTVPPPSRADRHVTPLPTTPAVPSRLSQVYIPGEDTTVEDEESVCRDDGDDERLASAEGRCFVGAESGGHAGFQFTFAVPGPSPLFPATPHPNAPSTPGRPPTDRANPPPTDPRLRLFQLNYDTFTRDHLSAMVDSIQLTTPSAGSGSPFTRYSPHSEPSAAFNSTADGSLSRLRSAKRLKLSPSIDSTRGDGAAVIIRPHEEPHARDYVGESKSLMQKIRQAQEFSTITTYGSGSVPLGAPPKSSALRDNEPPSGLFLKPCIVVLYLMMSQGHFRRFYRRLAPAGSMSGPLHPLSNLAFRP